MNLKKIFTLSVLFSFLLINTAAALSDVSGTSYEDAVDYLVNTNVIQGYDDGTFRPNNNVNRAEFTKIVVASVYHPADIEACDTSTVNFPDTEEGAWYMPYVCVAVRDGVVSGYPDGTFKPANQINLAEAAKVVANTLVASTQAGDDVWYKPYIMTLEAKAALPTTLKDFNHLVTRGEMVEMIYRLLEEIEDKDTTTYSVLSGEQSTYTSDSPAADIDDDETCNVKDTSCDDDSDSNTTTTSTSVADVLSTGTTTDMLELILSDTTITKDEEELILQTLRETMLNYVNIERSDTTADPLSLNSDLSLAAQWHAESMLHEDYFSHTGSDGSQPKDRIEETGYLEGSMSWSVGENIAEGQTSIMNVMDTWMDSPAHKDNILSEDYAELGVGIACGETINDCYWVQTFGRNE